jgi:hypothetical protein
MGVMVARGSLTIAGVVAFAAVVSAPSTAAPCVDAASIMVQARRLPADVTAFAYVEDAVKIRRELAARPIHQWIDSLARNGAASKAWSELARGADLSEERLFDLCFGRGFTFAARSRPDGQPAEWVVIASMGEQVMRDLLRRLEARVREPRFGLAVSHLPEQRMLLASDGELVVIGPELQPDLFNDVLQRVGDGAVGLDGEGLATLASDVDLRQRAPELLVGMDGARAALFLRHDRPLGGCSLLVADVRGDKVRLRHAGRFDNPIFTSPITRLTCDFSPVAEFEDKALIAVMQPQDVGSGPVETYLSASLGEGLVSPEMRKNLADRRMLIVGEHDARQLPEPSDMLTTTFVALELKDPCIAVGQLDDQMLRLTRKISALSDGAMVLEPPNVRAMRRCEPRQVNLGECGKWFTGGFPVMKTVSLNWAVAEGPHGAWFVVGSNPVALHDAVNTLGKDQARSAKAMRGRYDSCGVANGPRVGRHIENLSEQAPTFTEPANVEKVRDGLTMLSQLAVGMQDCRWKMSRPTANTMRLEVDLTLTPAETANDRPDGANPR